LRGLRSNKSLKGDGSMRSTACPIMPRLMMALLAASLCCCPGAARAGDGGSDAGTIQSFLNVICGNFGISTCPQLPTVTQGTVPALRKSRVESERLETPQKLAHSGNCGLGVRPSRG